MTMTGYALEGELAEWITKGHDQDGGIVPYYYVDVLAGAGGLRSNAQNMLTYLKANIGPAETDLERAMRDAHSVRKRNNDRLGMGLAWQVLEDDAQRIVMHGGATGGFLTMMAFDPDRRVGFVRLTNSKQFHDDFGMDFLRRGPPPAIPEVEVAA